jgi:hypothetical protein
MIQLLQNFLHTIKLFSQRNYSPYAGDAIELSLKQTVSKLGAIAHSEFKVAVKVKNQYVFYKCN